LTLAVALITGQHYHAYVIVLKCSHKDALCNDEHGYNISYAPVHKEVLFYS